MKRLAIAIVLIAAAGCTTAQIDTAAEEQMLLDLHANVLRAHLEDDVEGWLAHESEEMVVASRGEIIRPTSEERREQRERYLTAAQFETYRDVQPPIVTVSDDGTLGWVVCQVEGSGNYVDEAGQSVPIQFVSAWIEMYRKTEGTWQMVGNVSNFKPESNSQ